MSLSVVMRSGAKPCFFSSFRSSLRADRAQRRRWTKKSSTSPSSSTARHSQYFRPHTRITISSRCQRALARGRLWRRFRAISRPIFKPAPHRLIRNVDAPLGQRFLDIAERQREPSIEPDRVLDDFGREAMPLERNWNHPATVARPDRTGQTPNLSMPVSEIRPDFSLVKWAETQPYRDSAALDRIVANLEAAGLAS